MKKLENIEWVLRRLEDYEEMLRLNRKIIRLCEEGISDTNRYGDPTEFIRRKKKNELDMKDALARKQSLYERYGEYLPLRHDPRLH